MTLGDFIFFENDWLYQLYHNYLGILRDPKYFTIKAALNLFLQNDGEIIVETGTQRVKEANGSTTLFGIFCKKYDKKLFTVDINPLNMKVSMNVTKRFKDCITYVVMDSVKFLSKFDKKIDLLYLDSLDCPLPPADATEAQTHNLNELKAAYDKLHKGSILLMDDNDFANGGKTRLSKIFLLETGEWHCILDLRQSLWMKTI